MAIKKVSEFTEITSLQDNDMLLVERNGEGFFIKASTLKSYFGGSSEETNDLVLYFTKTNVLETETSKITYESVPGSYDWFNNVDYSKVTLNYGDHEYSYAAAGPYPNYSYAVLPIDQAIQLWLTGENGSASILIISSGVKFPPEDDSSKWNDTLYIKDVVSLMYDSNPGTPLITDADFPLTITLHKESESSGEAPQEGDYLTETVAHFTSEGLQTGHPTLGGTIKWKRMEGLPEWLDGKTIEMNDGDPMPGDMKGLLSGEIKFSDGTSLPLLGAIKNSTEDSSGPVVIYQLMFAESTESEKNFTFFISPLYAEIQNMVMVYYETVGLSIWEVTLNYPKQ